MELEVHSEREKNKKRARVLNSFLRQYGICEGTKVLNELPADGYKRISCQTGISVVSVKTIIDKFLGDMDRINRFFKESTMPWTANLKRFERKLRCYIHRIHRLSPVFDYSRARVNASMLLKMMKKNALYPKIGVQACLVIFITDINDKNVEKDNRLIQKNLRMLCNCSAFAFHRARNVLGINPE